MNPPHISTLSGFQASMIHPGFPVCSRVSHFESLTFKILYLTFPLLRNDFPVFPCFYNYNHCCMAEYFCTKPGRQFLASKFCKAKIPTSLCYSYFNTFDSCFILCLQFTFWKSCSGVDVFGCRKPLWHPNLSCKVSISIKTEPLLTGLSIQVSFYGREIHFSSSSALCLPAKSVHQSFFLSRQDLRNPIKLTYPTSISAFWWPWLLKRKLDPRSLRSFSIVHSLYYASDWKLLRYRHWKPKQLSAICPPDGSVLD